MNKQCFKYLQGASVTMSAKELPPTDVLYMLVTCCPMGEMLPGQSYHGEG